MANQNYSPAAVIIHWLIAVCIFFLFASSSWMLALPLSSDEFPFRQFPFQLHKNIGVTIAFLLALLLYIRFRRPRHREARSEGDGVVDEQAGDCRSHCSLSACVRLLRQRLHRIVV